MDHGKGRFALECRSAVIVIADPARAGRSRPLPLALVMGIPLLRWLTHALAGRGVERWLLVCPERWLGEARACFPDGCQLTACADRDAGNSLHVFLSSTPDEAEQVLVLIGACVCLLPEDVRDDLCAERACRVRCDELMSALDGEDFSFSRFLMTKGSACGQLDGIFPVSDCAELAELSAAMRRAVMHTLRAQGVQIWDPERCCVDPGTVIGAGTVLMPGTVVRGATVIGGDCVIGPDTLLENVQIGSGCRVNASSLSDCGLGSDCAVGPYVCIRSGSRLGSRVRVGSGTELSGVNLGEGSRVGALCALRDLNCGHSCVIGPGTVCAAGAPDAPVTIDDEAVIEGGVCFAGPVSVGRGAAVSAGSVVTQNVPSRALATARARQSVRKDRTVK